MKLLIITQVVDEDHPILGFFHRWLIEFAKHCEHVHVICLHVGNHSLPTNVTVHSLGKEQGAGRLQYLIRFYRLIIQLRNEYDQVFVHMNQIYVILGAPLWKVLRKKISFWYAHGKVSFSLRIATVLTDIVFTSTSEGFQIDTYKKYIVGQGIDTEIFTPLLKQKNEELLQLITVGRIAPTKNIGTLLRACTLLKKQEVRFHFKVIGVAITEEENQYFEQMKKLAVSEDIEENVTWVGPIKNSQLPTYLQAASVFIHDSATASLDKALLEAALCGCVVISSNKAYRALTNNIAPGLLFTEGDSVTLAKNVIENARYSTEFLQEEILKRASLPDLVHAIIRRLKSESMAKV